MNEENTKIQMTYEEALAKLEESVRQLEKGALSLDDSLKAFEGGIKWSRLCEEKLSEAKGRVEMLIKKANDEKEIKDFEVTE